MLFIVSWEKPSISSSLKFFVRILSSTQNYFSIINLCENSLQVGFEICPFELFNESFHGDYLYISAQILGINLKGFIERSTYVGLN